MDLSDQQSPQAIDRPAPARVVARCAFQHETEAANVNPDPTRPLTLYRDASATRCTNLSIAFERGVFILGLEERRPYANTVMPGNPPDVYCDIGRFILDPITLQRLRLQVAEAMAKYEQIMGHAIPHPAEIQARYDTAKFVDELTRGVEDDARQPNRREPGDAATGDASPDAPDNPSA